MGLFRRLFGAKKPAQRSDKDWRRWSFARASNPTTSSSRIDALSGPCNDILDASKQAIAVAAATAAVAEAALAAAHAAAEVVRLTSGGLGVGGGGAGGIKRRLAREMAAVKIQSAFRGYLARKALRALKALVKLQALVRGHIVRKQTADMLRRMQTLVRLQARARASRAHVTKSLDSVGKLSRHSRNAVHESSVKDECQLRAYSSKTSVPKRGGSNSNLRDVIDLAKARMGSNWLDRWKEESLWNNRRDVLLSRRHADAEKCDKILEVDTWKPHLNSQQSHRNLRASQHFSVLDYNQSFMAYEPLRKLSGKASNPMPNISSAEVLSLSSLKYPGGKDEAFLRTADNSPQVLSASSRPGSSGGRSPFTPARSECSWGYLSGYPSHPNYMANTESSRAKYRSQSAPRQRLEFDKYGSTRRTFHGLCDSGTNSETDFAQRVDLWSRASLASDRLNRLGSANQRA